MYELWNQALDVWGDQLRGSLKCLVSIGTGVPALKPVRDDVIGIWAMLKDLATETEKTAQQFHRDKSHLDDEGRYYRFNVDRGMRVEEDGRGVTQGSQLAVCSGSQNAGKLYVINFSVFWCCMKNSDEKLTSSSSAAADDLS